MGAQPPGMEGGQGLTKLNRNVPALPAVQIPVLFSQLMWLSWLSIRIAAMQAHLPGVQIRERAVSAGGGQPLAGGIKGDTGHPVVVAR